MRKIREHPVTTVTGPLGTMLAGLLYLLQGGIDTLDEIGDQVIELRHTTRGLSDKVTELRVEVEGQEGRIRDLRDRLREVEATPHACDMEH